MVRKSDMKTHGSHGPSGLDANEWQMLLTSYKSSSTDLCKTIAKQAIRIATSHLPFLNPYHSCRLIVFYKGPGVQPKGIGEVRNRINGRNIVKCIKIDIKTLGGYQQLCLAQKNRNWSCYRFIESCF